MWKQQLEEKGETTKNLAGHFAVFVGMGVGTKIVCIVTSSPPAAFGKEDLLALEHISSNGDVTQRGWSVNPPMTLASFLQVRRIWAVTNLDVGRDARNEKVRDKLLAAVLLLEQDRVAPLSGKRFVEVREDDKIIDTTDIRRETRLRPDDFPLCSIHRAFLRARGHKDDLDRLHVHDNSKTIDVLTGHNGFVHLRR